MTAVYLLWFVREWDDDTEDTELLIGVFSSEALAKVAIESRRSKPGFVDFPDGFQIDPHAVDTQQGWAEGFIRD